MASYASQLAAHVLDLRHDHPPEGVRRHAVRLITDLLGSGIYGVGTPQGQVVFREAASRYRDQGATVWGRGVELDAAGAALVNATGAHAYELDDYLPAGKTHPGTVIIPAAFAVADPTTSGEELVTAIIGAYDVMCRVAIAIGPTSARSRGFHTTGLTGPFGAAAVAGRLLGLTNAELTSALGIAASCSAGIFAFSAEGAMTKPLHAGRAAEAGVVAARLARNGFEGPTMALEAKDGGLLKAVSDHPRAEQLIAGLGERYSLQHVAIKPYPCCGSLHSSIDAVLELRRDHGITTADIVEIEAHNARGVDLQCGFPYTAAGGPVEAQMSLQYCLAAAIVDGEIGLLQFTEQRRRDPEIIDLAARVRFVLDPEIDEIYPSGFPALVRIILRDGSTIESRIPAPLGTPENPMDEDALRSKFSDLTADAISSEARGRLLSILSTLDSTVCVGEITDMLAPALGTSATGSKGA